jgi:prolyl-tRNA synthetase
MHDGKALQSGTSHNFGDGFAKAFGIQYTDKDNKLQYVHQTSWGVSTRLIGGIIMVHGDDSGLKLPPRVAPTQLIVVPIRQQAEGVLDAARTLAEKLSAVIVDYSEGASSTHNSYEKQNIRVKVDDSDKSPGWKFSECEMRGIPLRIELGPKDLEAGNCVFVRRDTAEKITVAIDEAPEKAAELLVTIQKEMLKRAKEHLAAHTYEAKDYEEFVKTFSEKSGFVKAMWCGEQACEDKIKEELSVTSRCMPFEQETLAETCVCCGKPATKMVYWGRAY